MIYGFCKFLGDYKISIHRWTDDQASVSISNTVVSGAQSFYKGEAQKEANDPERLSALVRQRLERRLKNLADDRERLRKGIVLLDAEEASINDALTKVIVDTAE